MREEMLHILNDDTNQKKHENKVITFEVKE